MSASHGKPRTSGERAPAATSHRSTRRSGFSNIVLVSALLASAAVVVGLQSVPAAQAGLAEQPQLAAVAQQVTVPVDEATYTSTVEPDTPQSSKGYLLATKAMYRAFVKFDTSNLGSAYKVVSASLRIRTISLGVKQPGMQVYSASNDWTATTLTANNRPAPQKKILAPLFMPTIWATQAISLTDISSVSTTTATSFELGYDAPFSNYALGKVAISAPALILNLVPATSSPTTTSAGTTPAVPTTGTATSTTVAAPTSDAPPFPVIGQDATAINLPDASTHKKLVFAHYFTPYPVSLDNRPPVSDYYANNYLQPGGENGKFAAVGGLLRDRPIPRDPLTGTWKLQDLKAEVQQAMAAGIDGFTVDVLGLAGPNWDALNNLISAADQVSPNFKIMLMPDMTSSTGAVNAATLASKLALLASRPSVYHLPDGRLVIAPFKGEAQSPAWWSGFMSTMSSIYGVPVAFMPIFLNAEANMAKYASISFGMSEWGVRDPASANTRDDFAAKAHSLGSKWMAPIAVQDVRPNQQVYDEAANTELLRASWARAISDGADFAQLVTWNDYSEGTAFAPSVNHGYSFLDINAVYQTQFQTGSAPAIARDAVYLIHRIQTVDQRPAAAGLLLMILRGTSQTAARDTVEVLTMLKDAGDVTVRVGSADYVYAAPAGVHAHLVPLGFGTVSVSVHKNGVSIASITSPYPVSPGLLKQDLEYFAVSSLRPTPRMR